MVGLKVLSSTSIGGGFFLQRVEYMKKTGFYIIKDSFFDDMDEPYLKGNKKGNRHYYYCFEDATSGLYWMIPLSSRIDKYKKIVLLHFFTFYTCITYFVVLY